ncbi:hypothetical protein [Bordetella sp. LUAb4]|uniref:hypothetical protein n=1 Tax=Bordetella sp. LUAb4 TaxID=2843195 RepID=UPI001E427803|nr:hypothetical protein [Bordetella sp. LUAb4]
MSTDDDSTRNPRDSEAADITSTIISDFEANFETRKQPNWSWIAACVACATTLVRRDPKNPTWSVKQCDLYFAAMGKPGNIRGVCDIEEMKATGEYNLPGIPTYPLQLLHVFKNTFALSNSNPPLFFVKQTIGHGFPVIVGLKGFAKNGRVITLYGWNYSVNPPTWNIADPADEKCRVITEAELIALNAEELFFLNPPTSTPSIG